MEFSLKSFNSLATKELFEIYKLRNQIFIVEQNCVYQDVDNKDITANHLTIFKDGELIGYSRILPPGSSYPEPSIGRVAILQNFRKNGLGKDLMKRSIIEAKRLYKDQSLVISAQVYLLEFYSELGFIAEGNPYPEDGIPHIKMRLPAS